ncbi:family 10 glycosylhydrolase [Cyanobium sp. FGCU-52]|nr:family 10 glycosylhydrolase [Cyanobium sp. FGCU52]
MARLRRLLLLAFGVCCLLVLQALPPALSQAGPPEAVLPEIRGVWLTANDMPFLRDRERMRQAVDALAELQLNTLYPVVWNDGIAYYPSAVSEGRGLQSFTYRGLQGQDILAELLEQAHGRGLLVVPWFEFGLMTPPGGELARRHPEWLTVRQDGGRTSFSAAGEVAWLNPFRPEVQQLISDLVLEVMGAYDVDGIQFDDHMSLPREFGYDPFTIAAYRRETGRPVPADPADPAWVKWRADKLTAFMDRLSRAVRSRRPGAIVSVSPNYYDHAYKLQLQDWRAWVRRGVADELLIQLYRPDVESFLPHLERAEVLESQRKIPVAIGIMAGQRNRPVATELMEAQAEAARDRQLGVAFFYLESLWIPGTDMGESRAAALRRLFPTPAPRTRLRQPEAGLKSP